jgi:hypothetical protein
VRGGLRRIGTTTQAFGTLNSWLVDVVNAVSGNLDRPGGAMLPRVAAGGANTKGEPGRGRGFKHGRWSSRVRGLGEVLGELPVAALAEEIETPGHGQVRALVTIAGNPVVSTPNAARLAGALEQLDFMVSVDIYVNETTRHADVILPAPSTLERSHYDLALYSFAVRDVANYSAPVFPLEGPDEWEVLLRLVGVVTGQGADADIDAIDRFVAADAIGRETATVGSPVHGADTESVLALYERAAPPPRPRGCAAPSAILDVLLRCGPYGAGLPRARAPGPGPPGRATGAAPGLLGLSLAALLAAPHGIDLGRAAPRLPEALRTPSGQVELAPPVLVADVARLWDALDAGREDGAMVLVGRRDLRSNNSWMHNLPGLVRGPARCTAWVHPRDAARLGLDRRRARRGERADRHDRGARRGDRGRHAGRRLDPARLGPRRPGHPARGRRAPRGANSNVLADELALEPLSGTAILNGIPVTLAPVAAPVPA